ncbi:MAG: superoxide dismutase [Succinivibrionaceae bacterium]
MALFLPQFNFELEDFEPFLSKKTLEFHIHKHLQGYINTANTLIKDTSFSEKDMRSIMLTSIGPIFNNTSQAFNHIFYFNGLISKKNHKEMSSEIKDAITSSFGSFEDFKENFKKSAVSNFGSGWTWLVKDPKSNKLSIINTSNAENPLRQGHVILLCIDVWEHAYYLDYQNLRANYVDNFFDYINWDFVLKNFQENISY